MPHIKNLKTCSYCLFAPGKKICQNTVHKPGGCLTCSAHKGFVDISTPIMYEDNHLNLFCNCCCVMEGQVCPYYIRDSFMARLKERLRRLSQIIKY